MKKAIVFLLLAALVVGGALVFWHTDGEQREYIRIHIRANSNDYADQQVKLVVRDRIVETLIPILANASTKEEAEAALSQSLVQLSAAANAVLAANGMAYTAVARMAEESFPTRQYGDIVLESGLYDALIIELGKAEGDNWWCIAYPPLCFVPADASAQVVYKSKILEIIKKVQEG